MIDDIRNITSFVNKKKKTREKDVVKIVTFDLIGLLPTNHITSPRDVNIVRDICESLHDALPLYCLYYNGITGKEMFDVNSKIAQTKQNI